MNFFPRSKPTTQKSGTTSQRATQVAALDAMCKARPLRPPTSTRPEERVIRKPLPNNPTI
jgi:hypothetical protein